LRRRPINWFKLGKLGVLPFTAVSTAKDHHDRSAAVLAIAFVTISATYVSARELSTLIRAGSGRTWRYESMTAGAVGPRLSIRHRGLHGD
jgi:hypothetical protein